MALHTISLCTGIGGIERGFELAALGAFKPVMYCEREISAAAVIAKEIERGSLPPAPIWSDVKTITRGSASRYLDQVAVDCITGGYPCQPFSVAGRRLGEDDPRHLWPHIAEAVERYAPTMCFFENVGGHLILGFREVCECLERMGYRVAAGLFTAAEVGATHRRERLFILAMADSSSERRERQFTDRETKSDDGNIGRSSRTTVGDAAEPRLQRPAGRWFQQCKSLPASFPPGPSGDWRHIVERWPELAPAIAAEETQRAFRSVADGLSRADQLRAYGNAVVPHCAAVAFISLWAALTGGGDDE